MADLRNFTYDNMVELIRQIRHGVDEDLTEIDEKIDKNTEDISDINDTVEGLVSQNVNPNIFRGTNVYAELQPVNSSDTWSTGEWCLYSNSSGTNSVQPIELTDSPINDVEVGWEIDNSEGILQSNIPLEVGTYTISAYIRGDGNAYLVYLNNNGTSTTQSLGSSFSDWTYVAVTLNNTLDYQTFGFSHSSTSSSGPGGGPGGGSTSQSIEICGMKLEAGDTETAWCPAYYDMENKYLQEDFDAIQSQIAEISSNVDSMQEAIDNVQTQVSNLQSEVTSIRTEVNNIQTEVTENQTSITNLQTQVSEISTTVTSIQTQVTENTNSITNVQNQVNEVSTTIDSVQAQVDANTENINDLTDTMEKISSENVNPNILRSTNSCIELVSNTITDMWDRGEWGSQRPAGLTSIEITDCPDPNITLGWRFSNETSLSNTFNIVQRGIPYVDGDIYTISCYARGHGTLRVALGSVSWTETCDVDVDSDDWVKIVETGYDTTGQARVLFTLVGDGTAAEIDICGMKLEKGENATDWCPSYWDMENKNLQADLDAVSAEIETVQTQVTENTTNISTAQQQIAEIIAEGGEPNVIEEIQVNGATLAIEDKTVNVPVPTRVSELDNDTGFITESSIPTKVSELENDSGYITVSAVPTKVSELENDSGYITESNVPTKLSELTDDVGYAKESEIPTKTSDLTNDSDFATNAEVKTEIAAQIAEIVAGAPEDLDTLKEIADWIEGHAEDAAVMNSEIKANTAEIAEVSSQADSTQSQVDSIQSNVDSLQTQVNSVDKLATANQTAIEDVQSQVASLQNQPSYVISYVKESKTLDISGG